MDSKQLRKGNKDRVKGNIEAFHLNHNRIEREDRLKKFIKSIAPVYNDVCPMANWN